MFRTLLIYLLLMLPISAWASDVLINEVDGILNWGLWSILIGSILGGITATFIKTEVDDRLSKVVIAKLFIGSCLGFFSCLSFIAYYPDTVIGKLALPAFVLGCLGAPIVVFALTWASSPDTFNKAGEKLNKKLGLGDSSDSDNNTQV